MNSVDILTSPSQLKFANKQVGLVDVSKLTLVLTRTRARNWSSNRGLQDPQAAC